MFFHEFITHVQNFFDGFFGGDRLITLRRTRPCFFLKLASIKAQTINFLQTIALDLPIPNNWQDYKHI